MGLTGALYEEDMGAEDAEVIDDLMSDPVRINMASESRLLESGIFSGYQVASIMDYRTRNGDILSAEELAGLDGFCREYVSMISGLVSFVSDALPGSSSSGKSFVDNHLTLKSSAKSQNGEYDFSYGLKYKLSVSDRFVFGFTGRCSYDSELWPPEAFSFHAVYYGRKFLGKLVVGDFNTRFGQGLSMWSGFSMSGIPSHGAFVKRPSGISPYWSYSGEGSHRGVAADLKLGDCTLTLFSAVDGARELLDSDKDAELSLVPGLNVSWIGMNAQASLTCFAASVPFLCRQEGKYIYGLTDGAFFRECLASADFRISVKGVELFSEMAMDMISLTPAALAGCRLYPGSNIDLAFGVRYYPQRYSSSFSGALRSGGGCSNEHGLALSGAFRAGERVTLKGRTGFGSSAFRHDGNFSVDCSYSPGPRYGVDEPSLQCKALLSYLYRLSPSLSSLYRISGRYRTYGTAFRCDVRCDLRYDDGRFLASVRLNALKCKGLGLLSYLEGGWKEDKFKAYLRGGLFRVDDWDDRIYAYERDAPGNFSVPAYYGRGFWTSAVCGIRASHWGRLYLRASYIGYPWMSPGDEKKKPGKAELKLQLVFNM